MRRIIHDRRRAPVLLGEASGIERRKSTTQGALEQLVVAVHAMPDVHAEHQEVEPAVQSGEHRAGVTASSERAADVGGERGEDAGLEQERTAVGVGHQDLVGEVLVQRSRISPVGRVCQHVSATERAPEKLHAGGSPGHRLDNLTQLDAVEAAAELSVEHGIGLARVQPEVVAANLGEPVPGAQP